MSATLIAYLRRRGRHVSDFGRARDGTSAIEFAIIAPVFLATVIAILEVAYFLFAQQTLQTAAVEFGRQFMTNQGPSQSSTINKVGGNYNGTLSTNSAACNIIKPLLSCGSVVVNVQAYQDYQSAVTSMQSMFDGSCNAVSNWNYNGGNPGEVVVVQLMYPLKIVTGPLGFALSNVTCNGVMQVMGVTAIRVEPS
jgi:Flp pilus assembly protein TadG